MSKTKLNTEGIFNELHGKSRFFDKPAPPVHPKEVAPTTAIKQYDNIAILQLDEKEIKALRQSTQKAQTFRFTEEEVEWLKDTAYQLSKELPQRRVNQADIVRLGMKFFEKNLSTNKIELLALIEAIK